MFPCTSRYTHQIILCLLFLNLFKRIGSHTNLIFYYISELLFNSMPHSTTINGKHSATFITCDTATMLYETATKVLRWCSVGGYKIVNFSFYSKHCFSNF